MPATDLHIVNFSVPYPPVYGGAIDAWYRIKALHEEGVKLTLHCFLYGPFRPAVRLEEVAETIHYYPRSSWPALLRRGEAFSVTSRKQKRLFDHLSGDASPILFESIQTTAWADQFPNRKRLLRAHNIEHAYYRQLAATSGGLISMIYRREGECLEPYEKRLIPQFDAVFSISAPDTEWFSRENPNTVLLPSFHGFHEVNISTGSGRYILYQGDLSLEINQQAVLALAKWIPQGFALPLWVAGRRGSRVFESKLASFSNLHRLADVSVEKMREVIRDAQIIVVHSLHAEGMKTKLFPALYLGRHLMANEMSRTHTKVDEAIHFYSEENFTSLLSTLSKQPFQPEEILSRQKSLTGLPDDREKARQIIRYL